MAYSERHATGSTEAEPQAWGWQIQAFFFVCSRSGWPGSVMPMSVSEKMNGVRSRSEYLACITNRRNVAIVHHHHHHLTRPEWSSVSRPSTSQDDTSQLFRMSIAGRTKSADEFLRSVFFCFHRSTGRRVKSPTASLQLAHEITTSFWTVSPPVATTLS